MSIVVVLVLAVLSILALFVLASSVQIVRPVEVRLVERLGKYYRTLEQGFHLVVPVIDRVLRVNVTEQMVDIDPQTVITKDKLNVKVDAVVYYKINNPKYAAYNVDDHKWQLVSLAKTTLRSVIGQMNLTEANENREGINTKVEEVLDKETANYGVDVLRVEIQELQPPAEVVHAMNAVVRSEQEKLAAVEVAKALEEKANGDRMAAIKIAEGQQKSQILIAEGDAKSRVMRAEADAKAALLKAEAEAKAIELVHTAAATHFKGGAVEKARIEAVVSALKENTKIMVPPGTNLVNLLSDMSGKS